MSRSAKFFEQEAWAKEVLKTMIEDYPEAHVQPWWDEQKNRGYVIETPAAFEGTQGPSRYKAITYWYLREDSTVS